ncbi:MAG: 16S rRNA (guanine(527)-N(7))-methyltransferase RsmG [Paludibacter sp.]|jgi:16S rRNA (guanine527-N7)-methyltransferase|nr:16S rRNA (guanine(527)-N(7))-methyltransferase RsmG [Paludibacter sp.]
MDLLLKYFPDLTAEQHRQFALLYDLYYDWNAKINVISRKDIENLYEHHVLHSLAIAKFLNFKDKTLVLDIGTGGGFPAIPLAILFPQVRFTAVDSIRKKILVANEIAKSIDLQNITFKVLRAEEEKNKYDFVVSRAVMPLADFVKLVQKNVKHQNFNALPNGIICLKGGEIEHEAQQFQKIAEIYEIADMFSEEYFKTKKIVYLPI